jgi:hypothetical protein
MLKKSIASALLVVMVAWAEMAMAPMFGPMFGPMLVMQIWHAHSAAETSEHIMAQHHAMPADHTCCPGISKTGAGKTEDAAISGFGPTSLPCQDKHRCCFRPGPLNVPAPVSDDHRLSRDGALSLNAELNLPPDAEQYLTVSTAIALSPPPGLFGKVLRV